MELLHIIHTIFNMPYQLSDIFEGDYSITQNYGERPEYYQQFGLKYHEGTDWGTPTGVKIISPFEKSKVVRTGWDPIYGYYIVLWDPKQLCAVWYCHLSYIYVAIGQEVPRGFVLGRTGNSGNSQGPHLHVNFCETNQYGQRLNTSNGTLGFINILGTKVKWLLQSQIVLNDAQKIAKLKSIINSAITDTQFRQQSRTILGV